MLHVPDITAHGWTLDTKGAVSVVWTLRDPESIFVRCNSVLILSLVGASTAQDVLRAAASV